MVFKSLLVAAACVAYVAAQSTLAFVGFPSLQQPVGQPVELKWEGGNGSPVTITLRQGDPNNLKDVEVITSSATGNSFIWTPKSTLASGSDYALQISQSGGSPNYYGPFALSGGSSVSNSILSSATASASSAISSASSAASSASSAASSITSNSSSSTSSAASSSTSASSSRATTSSSSSRSASPSSTGATTGGAAELSSPIALVFGAVAAMLYLN